MEAHGITVDAIMDQVEYVKRLTTDNAHALRQLDEAPHGFDIFKNKRDEVVKVVLKP